MKGLHALVVDDDFEMRDLLRLGLERRGMIVDEAASGREALERVRAAGRYDVIVSDNRMPTPCGLDVLRTMRSSGITTPFVLITAFSEAGLRDRVCAFPSAALVDKPFELKELVAQIERFTLNEEKRDVDDCPLQGLPI